jgi:hypothetical protein
LGTEEGGSEEGEEERMSESEKFEAQGRAQAALKQAKSNVATLNTSLNECARQLSEVSSLIAQFVKDPHLKQHGILRLSEHLKTSASTLPNPDTITRLVDELVAESTRVKDLQEQVDQF